MVLEGTMGVYTVFIISKIEICEFEMALTFIVCVLV